MKLTTKEIEKSSGLSRESLRLFVKRGWLPEPQFKSLGRYGSSLFWPENTVNRLNTIKSLKKSGYKNKAIDEILKGVKQNV